MTNGFSIHPDQLRGSAQRLGELGRRQESEASAQRTELAGNVTTWGSDQAGSTFGTAYQEVAERAEDAFRAIATGLGEVSSRLKAIADDTEAIDQAIKADLQRIRDERQHAP